MANQLNGKDILEYNQEALAAEIAGFNDVPSVNSGDNTSMSEVLGNKDDTVSGLSAYSRILQLLAAELTDNALIDTIISALYGTAGIATFPAGVKAGDGVSIAEVLRFTQQAVRNGTGIALAANKSLADAIGSNGIALAYGSGSALGAIGTKFILSGLVKSLNIITGGVSLFGVGGISGSLFIHEILLESDATGLAAGTNIEIQNPNGFGIVKQLVTTVAKLGANMSIRGSIDGEVGYLFRGCMLENSDYLTLNSTNLDCTGVGLVRISLLCERITAGATALFNANLAI